MIRRMSLGKWILLFAFLATGNVLAVLGPSRLAPTIRVKKGNIFIESTRNISLQADGSVNIQGRDLTAVIRMLELVGPRLNNLGGFMYNTNYRGDIQALRDTLMGTTGVLARLTRLEAVIKTTNVNDSGTETLESLSRKIYSLEKRVTALRRSLTHNDCASNPCLNGATCEDKYNGFSCRCQPGWEGPRCDMDINECARFNGSDLGCQHGATCSNTPGSYVCYCPPGFFGQHCTTRSNDCNLASSRDLCAHGICVNQPSKTGFKCICDQGWTTDPSTGACSVDVDECIGRAPPCSVNPPVRCINVPGSFVCGSCPAGFSGPGYYCVDVDECLVNNGGCSTSPSVQCINTVGSRRCGPCPPGYLGNGEVCNLVGLCAINNGGCHPQALCISASGPTTICMCKSGFVGAGIGPNGCVPASTKIEPATGACATNPCQNGGTCFNVGSGFSCACLSSFTGATCSERMSPCASSPCKNGGTCIQDNQNSYRCECPEGYSGRTCRQQQEACGGYIHQQTGELRFPMNARLYPHGVNCGWVIITNTSYVLNVTFLDFHLEASRNCNFDWLQIHDGASSGDHQIGRYCGTAAPGGGNIISTHNTLYLWFRSDSSVARDGFRLRWESIKPVCGSTIDLVSHASISSPGAPGKYPANRDCLWILKARPGNRIQLNFFSLQIESHPNCSYDYLQIRSHQPPYDILGLYCNTSHPAPVVSPGHEVEIRFHSDAHGTDTGFQIAASVILGASGCGGVLTASRGQIQPPMDDGRYLRNMDCTWKIQLPLNERLLISFKSFELELSPGCMMDFLEIREGDDESAPSYGRYCSTNAPERFISNKNVITIHFHTDSSVNLRGFTLTYESVCGGSFTHSSGSFSSPYYPSHYPDSKLCIYQIEVQPHQIISLAFDDFQLENSFHCRMDYLEIRDGNNENSTLIGRYCGSQRPEAIRSSTNSLYLVFRSDGSATGRGFRANYTSIDLECGGVLKTPTAIIEPPLMSSGRYRSNLRCTWVIIAPISHTVKFNWLSFSLENSRDCRFDYVAMYDNFTMSNGGQLVGKYCGRSQPPPYTSLENVVTIVFQSDSSLSGEGFGLSYMTMDSTRSCGGNYTLESGLLRSPNFPGRYPAERNCVYTIRVTEGRQIRVNFTVFALESGTDCKYDYLEIRNGGHERAPLIGKFCGTTVPPSFVSFTNELYLHFVTDHSVGGDGFSMNWNAAVTGCGGSLLGSSGSITSPNYPQSYGRNAECFWSIATNLGSKARVIFVDLDLEDSTNCDADYVEIWSGFPGSGKKMGRYCRTPPEPITTNDNHLYIKFHSDHSFGGRGFRIDYSSVCNTSLTGRQGIIESPGYPAPTSSRCHWIIAAPKGSKVNVTIISLLPPKRRFDRPFRPHMLRRGPVSTIKDWIHVNSPIISPSYLEIKEAAGSAEPSTSLYSVKFETYERMPLPPMISSSKDHVHVIFSDARGGAFRLEWIVNGCGGEFRRPYGYFSTPNYPKAYPYNTECTWLIRVDFGFSIKLVIKDINLETSKNCRFDALRIFGGADDTAPLLTNICHKSGDNITVTSSSNTMLVKFRTDEYYSGTGFRATYDSVPTACGGLMTAPHGVIHSRHYPQNYEPTDDCTWIIKVDPGHVIRFTVQDLDLIGTRNNCSNTSLVLYDGENPDSPELLRTCGNEELPNATTSTGNVVRVRMKADGRSTAKGFMANYTISCGARIVTSSSGVLDTSGWASLVGQSPNCSWIIMSEDSSKHVTLTISYLKVTYDEKVTNGDCVNNNRVDVHEGVDENGPLIGRYCARFAPLPITSRGSALFVHLVSPNNRFSGWFSASYSVLSSYCGGTLKLDSGAFASPGYPDSYPSGMDCEWTLPAAPGNRVQVGFRTFSLAASENCNADFVEVRKNGPSGELIGTYCGDTVPSNLTAANALWIKFRSSSTSTGQGFVADYSYLHGNLELTSPSGSIASPLYPLPYYGTGTIEWRILVRDFKRIQLNFKVMNLHDHGGGCAFSATLQVFDGYDDTAIRVLNACGTDSPDPVTSTSNVIYIKFQTEYNLQGSKFLIDWLQVSPNTTNSETEGNVTVITVAPGDVVNITSPGYPEGYKENLNVVWILETAQGSHLRLIFDSLDIENNGYSDFITVYTSKGGPGKWEELGRYFLPTATDLKNITAGASMKVVFTSDNSVNGTGFSARVHAACGGEYSGISGTIQFINPSTYMDVRHRFFKDGLSIEEFSCQWVVRVASGRNIDVDVISLKFPSVSAADKAQNRCGNSYLMLRNGGEATSPVIGRYCTGTQHVNTSSNLLYVKFRPGSVGASFELVYRQSSVSCMNDINLSFNIPFAVLNSPNYPNIPPPYTECIWRISAPPAGRVSLNFLERFDLTRSTGCKTAAVEVRDGGSENAALINRFCRDMPGTVKSTGSMLYIRFYTDASEPKNGFMANVSIDECGGTIRSTDGSISSPHYPHAYNRNLNCQWKLVVPEYHRMRINFLSFEVGEESTNPDNCKDSLTIVSLNPVEDQSSSSDLWLASRNPENDTIAKLCGSRIPENVTSPSNAVLITLQSSASSSGYKGFILRFFSEYRKCGGKLESLTGSFQSLGYPNSISRHHCSWNIQVPSDRRVTLYVDDMDLSSDVTASGVARQRVLVYIDAETTIYWMFLNFTSNVQTLESSNNAVNVVFISTSSSANRGIRMHYDGLKPAVCGGTLSREPTELKAPTNFSAFSCKWKWDDPTWDDPTNSTSFRTLAVYVHGLFNVPFIYPCPKMRTNVLLALGKTELYRVCSTQSSPQILVSPYPGTSISMTKAKFDKPSNITLTYSWSNCGGVLKSPNEITSPRFPSKYPSNIDCAWAINFDEGQQIKFSSAALDLKSGDYLRIYNGPNAKSPMLGEYTGNTAISETITTKSSLWIEFHSEKNGEGNGFKLRLLPIETVCGGISHDSTGFIASPNYPKGYNDNQECEWEIRSPDGFHIGLAFIERFNIEESTSCKKDYVEVFDRKGDNWVSLSKVCGRNLPVPFNSTGTRMKIIFHSDNSGNTEGFKARWNWNCGQEIVNSSKGTIISPGYPMGYPTDQNCSYVVRYPGKHISVQFEDFNLEDGTKCPYDNVSLSVFLNANWEGDVTDVSQSKGPYCGDTIPPPFRAFGLFSLKFRSDGWIQRKGFKLRYTVNECNDHITSPTEIRSPGESDDNYFDNLKCTWNITAPPGQVVMIKFTKIMVELLWNCFSDRIVIYNGTQINDTMEIERLCGNIQGELPTIKAGQNAVVQFVTDTNNNNGGFKAFVYFTPPCDKEIYLRANEESTAVSRSNYRANEECHWKITTAEGYNLRVTFESLTTSRCLNGTRCNCEFVEIRDGSTKYSELIGRYCQGSTSSPKTTSGNSLWIRSSTTGLPNGVLRFATKIKSVPTACGTPQTANVSGNIIQTFTSPGFPAAPPPNLRCSWKVSSPVDLGNHFKISFQDINLDGAMPCTGVDITSNDMALLQISREGQQTYNLQVPLFAKSQLTFCGNIKPPSLFRPFGSFQVIYHSGANPKPKAFRLAVTDIGCSGNFSDLSGTIAIMKPGPCINYIKAPSTNYTIAVYFRTMYIYPNDYSCTSNALEILDGSAFDSPRLAKVCGSELPSPVFSNSSSVTIRLVSTEPLSFNHISMTYIATDAGKGCGGYLTDFVGTFTSPMYPQNYRKSSFCVWTIEMHGASVPFIKFVTFNLGSKQTCGSDYLEFYDVDENGLETFRVRYCGGDTPAVFRGNTHRTTIKYTSSVHNTGSGWHLMYANVGTGESIPAVFAE